ncbi:MAG TPA: sugar phosphate isomerase/epimerase [bacterium]|nr:sugar phosphate isomerase/epimerase [bacterium]
MRRYGLNGATTGDAELRTDIRAAREAGYQVLEIRDTKLRDYLAAGGTLAGLRQELKDAGLEPYTLNALEHATHPTGAALRELLDRVKTFCEWAAALRCPYIVTVPSFAHEVADPDPHRVEAVAAEALHAIAEVAHPHRVRVGLEFLGFPDCTVNTLVAARRIVDAVGDPNVGLVIDAFHFYAGGSTWAMLDGLRAEQLFIVHLDDAEDRPRGTLQDAHRLLPGDGVIPLRDLVRRIEDLGYDGPWSIELFRPEYYAWDPVKLARMSRERMEALFEKKVTR